MVIPISPFTPVEPAVVALPQGRLKRMVRRQVENPSQIWDNHTNQALELAYHEKRYFTPRPGQVTPPTVSESWALLSDPLRARFLEGMTSDRHKSINAVLSTLRRQRENVFIMEEAVDVIAGALTLNALHYGVLSRGLVQTVVDEIHQQPKQAKDIGAFTEQIADKYLQRLPHERLLQPFINELNHLFPLHRIYQHEDPQRAYREFVALLAVKYATQFPDQLKTGRIHDPLDVTYAVESMASEFKEFAHEVPGGLSGPFSRDLKAIGKALDPGRPVSLSKKPDLQALTIVCQSVAHILAKQLNLKPQSPLIGELIKLAAYKMELRRGLDIYFRDGKAPQFVSSRRLAALLGDGIDLEDKKAYYCQIKDAAKKFEYARMAWVMSELQRGYSNKYKPPTA